jgi:predicted lipid-binding transport protein (Tim44 family)
MGAGLISTLLQVGLIALVVWLVLSFIRRRRSQPAGPAYAGAASPFGGPPPPDPYPNNAYSYEPAAAGAGPQPYPQPYPQGSSPQASPWALEPFEVTAADKDTFERLLTEVQDAFGREDYAALRARTTPEVMSYLAEELSENATHGRRNEVSDVRLLQADIAEAWREADACYATAALRYESRDVMRDRQTGQVLEGDATRPTETREVWTFVRQGAEPWKLSAIQA